MAKVKGFLFTIGFLIFITALFVLVVIVYSTTFQEDKRIAEIGSLDNLNNLDSSLKNSIKELFLTYSNINVNFVETNVSFNETIPNNITDFRVTLNNLKSLTESNFNIVSLNISDINDSRPIIIMPNRITYSHNFTKKEITIVPEEVNFNGYHITIKNINNATCAASTALTSGSFIFKLDTDPVIYAQSTPECDINTAIDPNQRTYVVIGSYVQGDVVTIEINNGGVAKLQYIQSTNNIINVTTTVLLNKSTGSQTKVMLPDSIIRISDPILKIYKKDGVRIL